MEHASALWQVRTGIACESTSKGTDLRIISSSSSMKWSQVSSVSDVIWLKPNISDSFYRLSNIWVFYNKWVQDLLVASIKGNSHVRLGA